MKKIFYLLFISIILVNFANATEMTTPSDIYEPGVVLTIEVKDKPNNYQDWIGIYPKNANNSWSNVIEWKWARDVFPFPINANSADEYHFFLTEEGDYEARFFLNNTYKAEYKTAFSVKDPYKISISINNATPAPNESIQFDLGFLSGDQDWVGIYPKGASNSWSNVVTWKWAETEAVTLTGVPVGAYEARLFFSNSYRTEASVAFNVEEAISATISLNNNTVNPNENIPFTLSNLSGDRDWVGIYPKDASNDWNNVITWNWAENNQTTLAGVPAGEYEARLFFSNSYTLEASVAFSVEGGNTDFWQKGPYEVSPVIEVGNNGLVYHPENLQGKNAPVVFLVKNHSSPRKKLATLINFIASHGYYVVLIDSSVANSNHFTRPRTKIAPRYIEIINYLKENAHNIDTSKIGVVGSSASGGNTFGILHRLKDEGYGSHASFILAIESWFAFEMNKDQMRSLVTNNTYVSILEYGVKGNLKKQENPFSGTDYTTDALFPLVNFLHVKADGNYLDNINYQVFESVGDRGHLYHQDTSVIEGVDGANYKDMKGVLSPLGGLMEFVFEDNEFARSTALEQGTDNPILNNQVKIKEYKQYNFKCNANGPALISYCDANAIIGNRDYINSIEQLNF